MQQVPILNARDILRVLQRAGFEVKRQNGSHLILEHVKTRRTVTVPNHNPVKRGTLRPIIHQSGMTVLQFLELLK